MHLPFAYVIVMTPIHMARVNDILHQAVPTCKGRERNSTDSHVCCSSLSRRKLACTVGCLEIDFAGVRYLLKRLHMTSKSIG